MRKLFNTFSIKNFDFILVGLIIALNLFGIRAIGSAAPDMQTRQLQGMIAGLILMVLVSMLDYNRILRYYWILYGLNVFLLLLVRFAGTITNGSKRWVNIGGITFQPSEAAKIILILFYAKLIMKFRNRMKSFGFIVLCLVLVAIPLLLIILQPDLSTTIMVFLIFFIMMFVGGLSFKVVGAFLAIVIPSVIIFVHLLDQGSLKLTGPFEYQAIRILSWLHPEDYETSASYQTVNSIMAIGSGMLTGKSNSSTDGFTSLLKSGYISESQTDFIFTVIGEEFGFIGASAIAILLALIAVKLFWIAREAKDVAGAIIAAGMGAWIGFQGFVNIAVATGLLPNTGLPLPFVSYGLTSLLSLYLGIGFVLNVRMQNRRKTTARQTHA
ncbi:rod shape determining protein RodA [Lachnospiraceae bacterium NK3A20]|nr:rod shape determining protein RodA [Lachnospiraceae bacterium NK3A20]